MRLTTRIHVIFGALAAALVVESAVALWGVHAWRDAVGALRAAREQSLRAERLRSDALQRMKEMFEHLLMGDLDAEEEARGVEASLREQVVMLRGDARFAEETAAIDDLARTHEAITAAASRLFLLVGAGRVAEATAVLELELDASLFPRELEELDRLAAFYRGQLEAANERTLAANRRFQMVTALVLVLVSSSGVVLVVGLRRWFVRPLDEIGRSIALIGTGDLQHRLPAAGPDELGRIAASINTMAAALTESQRRLVESQRMAALGELSASVAHNIRNPLASVRSAAQLALSERQDAEAVGGTLRDIIAAVDRLEGWLRQLLMYGAPLKLERVPRDVNELVREVARDLRAAIEARRVRIELDLAPDLPPRILDERHLGQALVAILGNALDASRSEGRVTISTRSGPGGLQIVVADEGQGMPPEVLQRACEPYFTTKPSGVGLGLPTARRIVEAQGGAVEIASAAGAGTSVTLRFPE